MSCSPKVVQDLHWKKINVPNGVNFYTPYSLVQVPPNIGNNEVAVSQIDHRKWTNVRGYGNILIYEETAKHPTVNFLVSPWNR